MAKSCTALRAARIQHNTLSAMENGMIDKKEAALRLTESLGITLERARAIVDGDDDGFNV